MSMTLMVKAMSMKIGNPLRKLVLIKLADNANDKGECWPSYGHIADQCEIGKSTVRKHIKDLENMGMLKIENRKGPKGNTSNLYYLTLHPIAPDSTPYATSKHTPVAPDSTRTSQLETVNESITETKGAIDYSGFCFTDEQLSEAKRIRKQNKGGPLTQRVVNGLAKEFKLAAKAGMTPDDILTEWEMRSWKSFKAEWCKPKAYGPAGKLDNTISTLQNINLTNENERLQNEQREQVQAIPSNAGGCLQ